VLEAHKQYSSNSSTIPSAKPVTADLSTAFNIEEFFSTACSWKKRIDVWVNAAGADVLTGCAKELSFSDKLHRLWQVDVQSTILLSRLAADYMRCRTTDIEEPKPTVINISWDQAERGMAGDSGQYFSAVKAAIAAFTRSLAMSIGPEVRANCLAPGWIQTSWGDQASSAWQQRAIGESSLHRWGNVGDIANAAVWLASKQAEFINGQVICINGGWRPSYQS
jgi:3-oxoacyl-[acyl-carrier protein] reductase